MSDPREFSQRLFEEVWNNQRLDLVDEMVSPDFVFHDPQSPSPVRGIEAYKQLVRYYTTAFPDLHFTIEDQVSDGTNVASRWSNTGTHQGDLMGIPATGRKIALTGITFGKIVDGKLVEGWGNWDTLGLLQQLGVAPVQAVPQAA